MTGCLVYYYIFSFSYDLSANYGVQEDESHPRWLTPFNSCSKPVSLKAGRCKRDRSLSNMAPVVGCEEQRMTKRLLVEHVLAIPQKLNQNIAVESRLPWNLPSDAVNCDFTRKHRSLKIMNHRCRTRYRNSKAS